MSWALNNSQRAVLSQKASEVTGQRWCAHGAHYAAVGGFTKLPSGREVCATCRAAYEERMAKRRG